MNIRRAFLVLALLAGVTESAAGQRGAFLTDVPARPRAGDTYLIYLHGRIIEEKGRRPTDDRFGIYELQQIIDTLAASGAQVIAEQRPAGTDFVKFGEHVAAQVRELLAKGVPAERIAVVGFSKGGGIAIIASALLANPRITFVFLAPCGDWLDNRSDVNVRGRILSIYEKTDELGTSCAPLFKRATAPGEHHEVMIHTGLGHGAFYQPRAEWLKPTLQWVHHR
jgi:acetyl esterase/lipase